MAKTTTVMNGAQLKDYAAKFATDLERKIFLSTAYAHSATGAEGTRELKKALSERHGASPKSKDYATAPIGDPPYMHTGMLRNSIGFVIVGNEKRMYMKVGSGPGVSPVEYAKPLDHGLHPFLYIAEYYANAENWIKHWQEKFRSMKTTEPKE
ncbi:hypothetical protein Dip510_001646 [Elusimicrobium posterum]|uniref:hypothetical protein n=1 Tax=Elusimicrobium posterum TaxID=3116653 RepID=UPI003C72DE06